VRHNRLAEDVEKEMLKTGIQGSLAANNSLESAYDPIVQSGESCTLKFNADRFIEHIAPYLI
jgi:hypothetical protein